MPKRPGKTKKTTAAPPAGKTPEPSNKALHEQRRDGNTKAILNKFQGRKSI